MKKNNLEEIDKVVSTEIYIDEVRKLEVSDDTSTNIKIAKEYIQSIIAKDEMLPKSDFIKVMKELSTHFSFADTDKDDFIQYYKNAYEVTDRQKAEENYQNEILKMAEKDNTINKVFPAIDYREDLGMIYGIKGYDDQGNEHTYIGMANKKIYGIEKSRNFGIIPTHEENIDSKFTLKNFSDYVRGKTIKLSGLYSNIKTLLKRYIVVPEEFFDVLITYIMMTYVYILFQIIPYLWINGERGTGKSTIMKLMNKLCFNPLYGSNLNPANIFRQIDNDGSTIILDEFEKMYGEEKQEIIKILNQGFNIDGIVPRCVGQSNQIKKFKSFSPKIMGGISNIDDVLFERCIKYTTQRVKDSSIVKFRETKVVQQELNKIVDELYIFGLIYAPKIKDIYDSSEIKFQGYTLREDDLWNPLLCIAKVIDEENQNTAITDNLLKYAKKLSDEKFKRNIENEPRLQLLYYLYSYFDGIFSPLIKVFPNGNSGVELESLYKYLSEKDELKWIKGSSSLGKKLSQWYGFEKKRAMGLRIDSELSGKMTYYLFTKQDIIQIMEDNHIKVEDYE